MKTYSPKPQHIEHRWYVMDASGVVLGRLASEVAAILRGKHKPIFAPHMDTGDHVVIVNADKVALTGNKENTKIAYRHSGYPGGITATRYGRLLAERPVFVIEKAVRGMLPKNRLGRGMIKKLHVVAGPEHPHAAQQPVALALGERPEWTGLPLAPSPEAPRPEKRMTAKKPTAKKPTAKKPTAKKPLARKPATAPKKPTAKKRAAKKPTARKPAAASSAKKPATAKRSTAKKPTAAKRSTRKKKETS
jgi:large subunit ribosomal protein L13